MCLETLSAKIVAYFSRILVLADGKFAILAGALRRVSVHYYHYERTQI